MQRVLKLPITVRRVQQLPLRWPHFYYMRVSRVPSVTEYHNREDSSVLDVSFRIETGFGPMSFFRKRTKNFDLDGPGWISNVLAYLRGELLRFQMRQNGGGSVMIWAAICSCGTSPVVFTSGKQESNKNCATVDGGLLLSAAENFGETTTWNFQQYGTSTHHSQERHIFYLSAVLGIYCDHLSPPIWVSLKTSGACWFVPFILAESATRLFRNWKQGLRMRGQLSTTILFFKLWRSLSKRISAVFWAKKDPKKYWVRIKVNFSFCVVWKFVTLGCRFLIVICLYKSIF